MDQMRSLHTPLTEEICTSLRAGDRVLLTGEVYTARDAAHRRICEAMDTGKPLPFTLDGAIIFYAGPTPAKPGTTIGSIGPTTSGRMDLFTLRLLAQGLKGMIGKGNRSAAVREAIVAHRAVYFAATGGAAALISQSIKKSEIVAYPELGAEAVLRLEVVDFPATVVNDMYGGDAYEQGKERYRRT